MLRRIEIINRLSQKGGCCTNTVRRPPFYKIKIVFQPGTVKQKPASLQRKNPSKQGAICIFYAASPLDLFTGVQYTFYAVSHK